MASLVLRVKMKIISTMTIVCIITGQSKIPKRTRYPPKKLAIRRMFENECYYEAEDDANDCLVYCATK